MKKLNYAEIKPYSGNEAKQLVIFLHGYGADGEDLLSLSSKFKDILPDTHFIAPNAPDLCEAGGFGYQWFSLINRDEEIMYNLIEEPAAILNNFTREQLERLSLTEENLIFIGFSQGTMMALHLAPRLDKACIVIAYSGMILKGDKLKNELKSKPEILIIHGKEDQVITYDNFEKAINILKENNFNIESHLFDNLGHNIDYDVIDITKKYLNKKLRGK